MSVSSIAFDANLIRLWNKVNLPLHRAELASVRSVERVVCDGRDHMDYMAVGNEIKKELV